jgi:hypothetical protein
MLQHNRRGHHRGAACVGVLRHVRGGDKHRQWPNFATTSCNNDYSRPWGPHLGP